MSEEDIRRIVREEVAALTPMILAALQKALVESLLRRNMHIAA